ncbi:MAG: H-X9-DG-CTERM domain-containing protein [Armatimonadota bacterium]
MFGIAPNDNWYAEEARRKRLYEIYTFTALVVFLLGVGAMLYRNQADVANRASCAQRLKRLMQAVTMYSMDYDAYPPESNWVQALMPYVDTTLVFICPADDGLRPRKRHNTELPVSYWYIQAPAVNGDPSRFAAAGDRVYSNDWGYHGNGANAGYIDGHVRWHTFKDWRAESLPMLEVYTRK